MHKVKVELKSNDNKKTLIFFIVESIIDAQRPDLFDIKLRGNDEEEVTIASCGEILRDI